jgi:general secretion pathway protein L
MLRVDYMLDWQARIDAGLRGALRWWLDELAFFVPEELRRWVASLRSRVLLVVDDTGTFLAYETGDHREPLGRVDLQSGQAAAVRRMLASTPQGRSSDAAHVVLCLPASRALRTVVALPLAAERNLEEVVGFEFERLVPFKRDAVYYAHRILSRNKVARTIQVELTVVPRSDAQEISQLAQRTGLQVVGLEVAGPHSTAADSAVLLHGSDRPAAHPRARLAIAALGGLTVLLAVAAVAIPFLRASNTVSTLTAQVAEARREAEASLNLQKQIDAEIQDQQFLVNRKRQYPTVTELLDTITKLTPDDTWLTELQVASGEVHLIGASGSATALLGLVDQSPSFRNAAFRSSITQDSKINRERFDIAARIAPREGP